MLILDHKDGKPRCSWPGYDPLYIDYHDSEWGVPEYDDRALYEKFILDGFQAGLSWITILKRREGFREAFQGFDPLIIASWGENEVETLMQDTRIIRNRAKIKGTIKAAQLFLDMQEKEMGFSHYLWNYFDGRIVQNSYQHKSEVPPQNALSEKIAKDMKKRGFTFCGPTILYAFFQATGFYNDHLVGCFRHEEVKALRR